MLMCPRCGGENQDKDLYCAGCHTRLPSIVSLRSALRYGLEALDKKDYKKALEKFMEVARQNPSDVDAVFLIAVVKMRNGRGSEAWNDLIRAGLAMETGKCTHCRGTKKCPECGGTGICLMCRGLKRCSYCSGLGSCPNCNGVRPQECRICKGTGQCIRCKGSNECSYCNGYGNCSHCSGTGGCTNCGSTGTGHKLNISRVSREFQGYDSWFK